MATLFSYDLLQNYALLQRTVKSLEEELKESKISTEELQKQETHWKSIKYEKKMCWEVYAIISLLETQLRVILRKQKLSWRS